MIFSALLSFLGGSAFRMIWGEISSFLTKKQDHEHEVALLELQAELEDRTHDRELETLRLQSELGIRTIEAQREAAVDAEEARSFTEAMANAFRPTGNKFIDAWNGGIRPAFASVSLALIVLKLFTQGFKMDEWDMSLVGLVAGFFFADRSFAKRNK